LIFSVFSLYDPHLPIRIMNNEADHQTAEPRDGVTDESGNVDRIRDILFGNQMRDYDTRFQRLNERVSLETGEIRADVHRQLQAFETFLKSELESMMNRLRGEHAERAQAMEQLAQQMAETARGLELKIGNLDNQTAQDVRDLRERLLYQSKALSDEFKEKHDQLKSRLEEESGQIRDAMTGRESLAEMLSELALRLKREFRVPGVS
jgi:hypothetical protein